jgi:heme/copper-type cytochrome/quinol oxidase subunit 3
MSDKHVVGMTLFVIGETIFFTVLIMAFVFYRQSPFTAGGPTDFNILPPELPTTGFFTACLTGSSLTFWLAERHHRRGHMWQWHLWLVLTILLGAAFVFFEAREFHDMSSHGIVPNSDLFGTTFYSVVGFHGFHVSMGILTLLIVFILSVATPHFRGGRHATALTTISIYWFFVDGMWWIIFPTIYLWSLAGGHGAVGHPLK